MNSNSYFSSLFLTLQETVIYEKNIRIIISGGRNRGHIFPAVSIANAIKEQHPEAEILFVGAEGRNGDATRTGCRLSDHRITCSWLRPETPAQKYQCTH